MQINHITNNLAKLLPSDFIISSNPDHPYLYPGPNILIGGKGNLVAIFIPRKSDLFDIDSLLARFISCRLGLPEHTRCVLLFPPDIREFDESILCNFHEVFDIKETSKLLKFITDAHAFEKIKPVPAKIRQEVRQRYQFLHLVTNLRKRNRPEGKEPGDLFEELKYKFKKPESLISFKHMDKELIHKRKHGPRNLLEYEGSLIGLPYFKKYQPPLYSINSYFIFAIRKSYNLDMGIPYPKNINPNILVVNRIPKGKYDINKPIRVAAFSGWVFAAIKSSDEIIRLSDRLNVGWEKHIR